MTTITLEAFIRKQSQMAEARFNRHGEYPPTFVGDAADGTRILQRMDDIPDKDIASATMRRIAADRRMVRCCFISEMWTLKKTNLTPEQIAAATADAKAHGIANRDDRGETVVFMAEDYVTGALFGYREIMRNGARATLGKLEIKRPDRSEGRFIGLLPPQNIAS